MTNNEMMIMDDSGEQALDLGTASKGQYCSMRMDTLEEKVAVYNAMSNPDERIADHINEVIELKDVFCEIVECSRENQETGEIVKDEVPRIVLVATNGKTYQCVSQGIFQAVKRLIAIFGAPTWEQGLKVRIKQVNSRQNKVLTLVAC